MSVVRLSVILRLVNECCTTVRDSSPAVSTQSRPQQCRLSLQSRLACVQLIQAQSAVTHWRLGEARRGVDPEARPSGPTRSGPNPAHCAVVAAVSSGVPSAQCPCTADPRLLAASGPAQQSIGPGPAERRPSRTDCLWPAASRLGGGQEGQPGTSRCLERQFRAAAARVRLIAPMADTHFHARSSAIALCAS